MKIDETALESMLDGATLADVVLALSNIATEKALHIRANWQDTVTARPWRKAGSILDKTFRQILELGI